MSNVNIAIEEYKVFLNNTLKEQSYVTKSTDCLSLESLSSTSMYAISQEGLIDWAKDKLRKLGQRFVVLVNKIAARFSKNREKLEANIKEYQANPNAEVELAVSPKTLKMIGIVSLATATTIAAIVICIPRKDGKTRIGVLYRKLAEKIKAVKDMVKRDKAKGGHKVSAKEAAQAAQATAAVSKKTEDTLKQAGPKVAGTQPQGEAGKDAINNAARATSGIADAVNDVAGLQDVASQKPLLLEDHSKDKTDTTTKNKSSEDKSKSKNNVANLNAAKSEASSTLESCIKRVSRFKDDVEERRLDLRSDEEDIPSIVAAQRAAVKRIDTEKGFAAHKITELKHRVSKAKTISEVDACAREAKSIVDRACEDMQKTGKKFDELAKSLMKRHNSGNK